MDIMSKPIGTCKRDLTVLAIMLHVLDFPLPCGQWFTVASVVRNVLHLMLTHGRWEGKSRKPVAHYENPFAFAVIFLVISNPFAAVCSTMNEKCVAYIAIGMK